MFEGESVADIRRFDFASGVILFAGAPVRNVEGGWWAASYSPSRSRRYGN